MICVFLIVITMMGLLTACSGGKCGLCGKKSDKLHKTYNPYVVQKQEIKVCDACYESMGLGEMFLP